MLNAKSIYKSIHKSRHIFRAIQHMYLCIHAYVHMCIYMHTCTYECMIWESTVLLCVDLCLEWRWSTTGCHLLTFFFLLCNTFGERPKLWPGPHSVRLCACLRCLGLSASCLCACTGLAFNARWCTGCSLWLVSPVFGRGMHQQFIYTLCEYVLPSPTHILRTYSLDAHVLPP